MCRKRGREGSRLACCVYTYLNLAPPQTPTKQTNKQTEYCDGSSYSALVPEPIPNAGVFGNRTLYYRGQRVHQAFMEEVNI